MSATRSLHDRVPLKPGTAPAILAAFITLGCAEFVRSGLYSGYLIPFIDAKNHMFHLPAAVGGLAWTTHLVADTLMRGPAGLLLQRHGPRKVVMAGAVLCLAALSLLLVAKSAWMILLIAALHGIGFSPFWPAAMNLTADAAKPGYEGRVLTVVSTSVMPLSALGTFTYALVAKNSDTVPLLTSVSLGGLALALTLLLPLRRLIQTTGGTDPVPGRPRLQKALMPALLPLLPAALMQTLTQSLAGAYIIRVMGDFGLELWQLVAVLVVGGAVAFASMPFTGRIADRGRAQLALTVGFLLVGLGMLSFLLHPPLAALFLIAPVVGLGYAFLTPGWAALVAQMLPESQRPAAWGVIMTVESAGQAGGPAVGAVALQAAGAGGPFGLAGVLALLTAAGYLVFRQHFQTPHLIAARSSGGVASEPVPGPGAGRAD